MTKNRITRRDFLRHVAASSTVLVTGLPLVHAGAPTQTEFQPDLALELTAAPRRVAIRPGPSTPVWSYQARVLKGDPARVHAWPGGYLGPILHVHRGQNVRIDFVNRIDQATIVNWHGLHVAADMMGLPRYEVGPGARYRYEFQVRNRAGTYWYHAMAAGHTPQQVYFGLAGLLVVSDDEEQALALPRGEYDVPIVIQDRTFGDDNRLRYLPGTGPGGEHGTSASGAMSGMGGGMMGGQGMMAGGMGAMMTRVMGFFGDTILVNGHPNAAMQVATHPYRLRVLNASNARTYKLAWQDGRPLTVLATGGGLLEQPLHKDYVMLTPGQRIELWVDFSRDPMGTQHTLMSRAFAGSMGMMGGDSGITGQMMSRMMSHSSLPDGAQFPILKLVVARQTSAGLGLPQRLSSIARLRAEDAVNRNSPRTFRITMRRMQWGFDGRSFEMGSVAADEIVRLATTEIWEFENNRMMAHAIHVHGRQFLVLGRSNSPQGDGVVDGYVDQGWEDTVLIMPSERVRLIMRFADFTGTYAYQCHMLEHAASGLMRNYRVAA